MKTLPIHVIADFQLPIADWQVGHVEISSKDTFKGSLITVGNRQSAMTMNRQLAVGNRNELR